jgi:hypothetical protein
MDRPQTDADPNPTPSTLLWCLRAASAKFWVHIDGRNHQQINQRKTVIRVSYHDRSPAWEKGENSL